MSERATDAELVARYRAGEPEAFRELVNRHTPALYNLVYAFTGDRAESEHLTQETWLRVWSALARIQLDRPLKPYLLRVAINLCRTWAARKRMAWLSVDADEIQDLLADESEDVFERLSKSELQRCVRAAIEKLPPLYRTVLVLRYSEDLSYEEIAEALNLPLNTVRTHLRRAKAKLRELLSRELD